MMQTFRTESNYRSANRLSPAELRAAMANREILQSTALAFDTQRQLRFALGGTKAVMPFAQCRRSGKRLGAGYCRADTGGPPHLFYH